MASGASGSATAAAAAGSAPADAAAGPSTSGRQATAQSTAQKSSGVKRQRQLAPLPAGAAAQQQKSGGGGGKGRTAYKEPGPGTIMLPGGGRLDYQTNQLFSAAAAATFFRQLRDELPWEQRSVRIMGKAVPQPRLIAYQADGPELQYTYSGLTLQPQGWHPAVAALKARAEAAAGTTFNCCLLNRYRGGDDCIGWHSDNDRLFGAAPTIASVSLGDPREFLLRRNSDHADKYKFRLGGGTLLVMGPGVQASWMHGIPKRAGNVGERISLTFRRIVSPERRSG